MRQVISMMTLGSHSVATLASATSPAFAPLEISRPEQPVAQWAQTIVASEANDWYIEALEDLRELAALEANWDLEGSPRLGNDVLALAVDVLDASQHRLISRPHIAPIPGGGIQFEYRYGDRDLELSVVPEETDVGVVRVEAGQITPRTVPNDPEAIRHQLDWLVSGHPWL